MKCEGSHIVRFILNDNGFVEIKGCPYKWDTNLRVISLNDILESKDILSLLKEVHSYNYEDKRLFGAKCWPEEMCDWRNEKIKEIGVCISRACNIHCVHCGYRVDPSEKDKENYFKILEKIKGNKLEYISLTSVGEPFIYKKETFDYLKSLTLNDCKIVKIQTNATLIDEKDIDLLEEIKNSSGIDFEVVVSIDSIYKENFEKIRVGANFEKVLENIDFLNKKGFLRNIDFCVQRDNFDEIPFVIQFFEALGLKLTQINLNPVSRHEDFEETEKAWKLINSAYKQIYEEKGNSIKYLKNHS